MGSASTGPRLAATKPDAAPAHYDIEAERTVLGSCLIYPELVDGTDLRASDFWSEAHARTWSTVLWVYANEGTVDSTLVRSRLVDSGQLASVGGEDFLLSLTDGLPTRKPPFQRVKVCAARRAVESAARRMADAAVRGAALTEHGAALDDARSLLAELENQRPRATQLAGVWKTLGEWGALTTVPPPRRWLLTRPDEETNGAAAPLGVLQLGKVGLLIAAGGAGKTMALIELALAVATGRKWLDYFEAPNPGRVLVALGEEDAEEVSRRFYAVARAMRLTDEQMEAAAQRVVVLPLAGIAMQLVECGEHGTAETVALQELRRRLAEHDWRLVVLDPLSRFAGADSEKDNAAATRFIQAVESLVKAPGAPAVLVAHHTNKLSRAEGSKASAANARGASAITDGGRWVAELESLGDDGARLSFTKSNYGRLGAPLDLVRDATWGGYLRVATPEEVKRRTATATDARTSKERERALALAERICAELRQHPNLSKDALRYRTGARRGDVIVAVDLLESEGRVTRLSRFGYSLVPSGGGGA